jgi:myo-inositol-1(or 4)-monophosphatase
MEPTLIDLEGLARAAGQILLEYYTPRPGFGRRLQVDFKSAIDPVTEADYRSEAYLLGEIRRRFPETRIVSEESGATGNGGGNGRWYVDPLDGTVNYSHGVPLFAVSIGYAVSGSLCLGVVYDPLRDELFAARTGGGATLNGEPIRVSPLERMEIGLLGTGFPYDIRTRGENNLDHYARFALSTQGVRRLGSAALDLCYVAAGRLDGYWELTLGSYDLAAGTVIAREAGAVVTQIDGNPDMLAAPFSALAANPVLHREMLACLNSAGEC